MLKDWHRTDIFSALESRGWRDPSREPNDGYFVGELYMFSKADRRLHVAFVADIGTGFSTAKSIEEVWATLAGVTDRAELWLSRRRDGKWHAALREWVEHIARIEGAEGG